ncbi:Malonyl CoA-acyl carrier protein transacylase [Desulfotomaculum arcticum]|uniref:Malonyl CoA-acyl carrier protein transacylase n=1 Tax=Desulfotruncus arcticus DSM 17038 TaxID=1121424 RepID=A0A1I2X7L4_9FIRM|nr:SDR family NAD(P)-dependent oxidoreductase [Desulfotruncus arcticus]SFH09372.1 Malonyl CoA-acyl carrier protein transacylase [Desulfotomaculum arcticum] [Desulfotruncus arcticus DSM 17038]
MAGMPARLLQEQNALRTDFNIIDTLEKQGIYIHFSAVAGKTAFLFPGHGAQYPNMMRDLFSTQPVVEDTFRRADEIYRGLTGDALTSLIFSRDHDGEEEVHENLKSPEVMQPAIYTANMAMFYLVADLGLHADLFIGHSLGEFAALAAGGAVTFEDGLRAVYARACSVNLINPAQRGAMISIQTGGDSGSTDRLLSGVKGYFTKSIVNSPEQLIISGASEAVDRIHQLCREKGIPSIILPVSHAFHSKLMAAAVPSFEEKLRAFRWRKPEIKVLSSIHGEYYDRQVVKGMSSFLASQLITPFNFRSLILKAYDEGVRVFVEVGPKNILSKLVRKNLTADDVLVAGTNLPALGGTPSWKRFCVFCNVHGLLADRQEINLMQGFKKTVPERGNSQMTETGIKEQLVQIVAGKTGYPRPLIQFHKKIVVELGVGLLIYQAILRAVREKFSLSEDGFPQDKDLTLQEIYEYLAARFLEQPGTAAETTASAGKAVEQQEIEQVVLAAFVEKTGYPREMLEPDLDLEADLGIDSVKQAEIFGYLKDKYTLVVSEEVKLKDLNTIGKIVEFVAGLMHAAPALRQEEKESAGAPSSILPLVDPGQVEQLVIDAMAEKTGYPREMLEPDLDLEADLGIDSVKQAEIFGQLQEAYRFTTSKEIKLKDLNTIRKITDFIIATLGTNTVQTPAEPAPAESPLYKRLAVKEQIETALRYVPLPMEQPFPSSPASGMFTVRGKKILVMADRTGEVAGRLISELRRKGAQVYAAVPEGMALEADKTIPASFDRDDSLQAVFAALQEESGGIQSVINLYPLVKDFSLFEASGEEWEREVGSQFNVNFLAARAFYKDLQALPAGAGGYFAATNTGGVFGLEATAGQNPLGGLTAGFVKSLQKELPNLAAKVVDFPAEEAPETIAQVFGEEIELPEDHLEIGYTAGGRKIIQVLPVALQPGQHQVPLSIDRSSVILVSGGGRGIIFECLKGLCALCQPQIVITGRTAAPDGDEEWLRLDGEDFSRYRQEYMKKLKKENPALTPLQVERESRKLIYARELFRNLQELKAMNSNIHYEVCDVADREQVLALVDRIRERFGPIEGVLHGAGLESFGAVPKKPVEHSRNVVRVKVNGFRHLWKATRQEPLKFFVNFGSISGRFGMDGQVDYCAAADAVARCSYIHSRSNAAPLSFTIDWTAWADTGMAAYDSVRRVQEQRGLTYLEIKEGVHKFLQELFFGGEHPEVMIFGSLGLNSPPGQLDSLDGERRRVVFPARPDGVVVDRIHYPLLERVSAYEANDFLNAEKRLHLQEDLYLSDHLVDGAGTFPGVLHVESHCEAASLLCPDHFPARLRDVEFIKFIKYYERNPLNLKINARVRRTDESGTEVEVEIRSDFVNSRGMVLEKDRLHSRGTYLMTKERQQPRAASVNAGELLARAAEMNLEKFYQHTSRYITFGPTFRSLQEVRAINDYELVSETLVPRNEGLFASVGAPRFLIAPVVIDNACRSTLLWSFHTAGHIVVPRSIDEVIFYRAPLPGEKVYAYTKFLKEDGDLYHFKVEMIDSENNLLIDMPGLVMVRINSEHGDTGLL